MRRQVLDDARAEGREELDQLRRQIRQMQLGLQRANAPVSAKSGRVEPDHGALREALKQVERMEEEVAPLAPLTPAPLPETDELRIGDTVLVTTLGQTGELLALNGQEAEVRIGGFRLRSHRGALQFQARPVAKAATPSTVTAYPTSASPGIELDLRGWRAEEVASALDKYLDDAYMAGLPWVHIIHGKGMGVLKNVVRQFLAGHPLVSSHRPGAANEGGEGVTVVTLAISRLRRQASWNSLAIGIVLAREREWFIHSGVSGVGKHVMNGISSPEHERGRSRCGP